MLSILKQETQNGENPVVVLSAMSGVTNLLVSMAEQAALGKQLQRAITATGEKSILMC